jgi:VanZ family protein
MATRPFRRSAALWLVVIYALLIVYASLHPFSEWRLPAGAPAWQAWWLPWPPWRQRFDEFANVAGYVPFGALVFLAWVRQARSSGAAVAAGLLLPALVSWGLEGVQTFLPTRVPSARDWMLNVAGAAIGVVLGRLLQGAGAVGRWDRWRDRWFHAPADATLVLLALWPVALLFPSPVVLGLGQIFDPLADRLHAVWLESRLGELLAAYLGAAEAAVPKPEAMPARPLSTLGEATAVALGFLAPCAVAFASMPGGWRRQLMLGLLLLTAMATTTVSTALNFGPANATAWITPAAWLGLLVGGLLGLGLSALRAELVAVIGLAAISAAVALVSRAPHDPYFAASLRLWEQGPFVRFHGLAQWVGWIWPYAAAAWLVARVAASLRPRS